jgi:hypothetical protein
MSDISQAPRRAVLSHLRAVGIAVAAGCAAGGLYEFQVVGAAPAGWWWLAAALLLGVAAQAGLCYPTPEPSPPPGPSSPRRRVLGGLVALAGAALWGLATARLYRSWTAGFDFAWTGWTGAVVLMGVGLDLAWGTWPRAGQRRWSATVLLAMAALLAVAAVYRLGNIADFPGEAAITQIEDLQVGNFGWAYLNGQRLRWEFLSSTWLAALGIWLGGPSQLAERVPFAVVSALKVLPVFVWLRLSVGTAGALVGTALLAGSFWDVVLSRIPNNHNALIVAIVFSLLAGPVRRGRPSAYVLLGFLGGYILHEYVAYRPLALWAVAGAVWWSLRDPAAGRLRRVARPAITIALLATMVMPLFLGRISNTFALEYLDGWNRAHGVAGYYNPTDTWQQSLQRRFERARAAAELFTLRGDRSPVRNVPSQPPLIDPVTGALLVLGMAGAAANLLRPVYLLTLIGFAVTVAGTLILTGNFDVARVGGAVPYVYVLAGFGAAGLWTAWGRAWGRPGRALAALLLAAGVAGAGYWCTSNLIELWTNPTIRRAHRNNLAYLTIWLRDHTHPDDRVLGFAPGFDNVLEGHDGSWLRGRQIPGVVAWDIESALRHWPREPGPTLLFIFAGRSTEAIAQFLETLLPELKFQFDVDPLDMSADVAYAHLPGPPPELAERLDTWHCRGVHASFSISGAAKTETLFALDTVAPFICKSTWPAAIPQYLYRLTEPASGIRAHYTTPFAITTGGDYRFSLETYAGSAELFIDGVKRDANAQTPARLEPGLHDLDVTGNFAPMAFEPSIRLLWSGPDTDNRQELMPFYRVAPVDPTCAAAAGQAPFATGAAGARRYLTDWLVLGPFDSPNGSGAGHDFIDVAELGTAPQAAAAAGQRWTRIPPREEFIDLAGFYASTAPHGNPEWACAYAATRLESPAAQSAFLELAGSGDSVQVWLNGAELTSGPLAVGIDRLRHPVDLRRGANLLVLKSCKAIGAWYFIARVADAGGHDLPDVQAAAALPAQPIPAAASAPQQPAQLLEGIDAIVSAPHDAPTYGDYRGGGPSSWAYVEDQQPEVTWRTPPAPAQAPTVLALTASTSPENGEAQLFVNGHSVLAFAIGTQGVGGRWSANGYQVAFVSKGFFDGNSGILLIGIPPEAVTPGQPIAVRVALTAGAPRAWFMIKGYHDTVAREGLSPRAVQGLLNREWVAAP